LAGSADTSHLDVVCPFSFLFCKKYEGESEGKSEDMSDWSMTETILFSSLDGLGQRAAGRLDGSLLGKARWADPTASLSAFFRPVTP
jgi:hypothetical protein